MPRFPLMKDSRHFLRLAAALRALLFVQAMRVILQVVEAKVNCLEPLRRALVPWPPQSYPPPKAGWLSILGYGRARVMRVSSYGLVPVAVGVVATCVPWVGPPFRVGTSSPGSEVRLSAGAGILTPLRALYQQNFAYVISSPGSAAPESLSHAVIASARAAHACDLTA